MEKYFDKGEDLLWALRHGSVISRMLRWCRHGRTWTSIPRFKDTTLLPSLFLSSGDLFPMPLLLLCMFILLTF